jgi:hypothetical protein
MPQADITLNLLRSSRRQPNLSAYACLNGNFDFNRSPLASPGTRVVVHITPAQRPNRGPHSVDGWYVGSSPEHYRCHKCYIPSTFGVRDALTIDWFPHNVPFPRVTTDEYLRQTAHDMLKLIQNKTTHPIPSLTIWLQHHQRLYTNRPDFETRNRAPFTATSPCTRTEGAAHHTPCTRTEGAHTNTRSSSHHTATVPSSHEKRHASTQTGSPLPIIPSRPTQHILPTPSYLYQPPSVSPMRHPRPIRPSHHIAALATAPPTAGKQGSLTKLVRGSDATIWERSLANE